MIQLESYANGTWIRGEGDGKILHNAITGEAVASIGKPTVDFKELLHYGRSVGNPAMRSLTFHERGRRLKALAQFLMSRKEELYALSALTGATKTDSWIDIEGGIGTLFVYASKGRRDFPDEPFYLEGPVELLSRGGTFVGRHMCVPLEGVAIHINAFNFPCWGMLEKLATSLLAGMPAIVKPASISCFLAEKLVRLIVESGILPEGALQLISGSVGDLLDYVDCQDVVTFTGSATTGHMLRTHPQIQKESVRFNMEADSLNCCILGPDCTPDSAEFSLFVKEVVREMTVKAGQKCTAIRRILVPSSLQEAVAEALQTRLASIVVGDPACEGVRMGALASAEQVEEVRSRVEELKSCTEVIFDGATVGDVRGEGVAGGAFFSPTLLVCDAPLTTDVVHDIEAFGPVSTLMPYTDTSDLITLARRGMGSLVGSVFTRSSEFAKELIPGIAPWHGRLMIMQEEAAKESTGHGSPLPHLVHGGPGRAGGGEEMGGIRGVLHYMQRTALQGHPEMLSQVGNEWVRGAHRNRTEIHPFQLYYEDLSVGDTFTSDYREITSGDIQEFAELSGDKFYAHMDDDLAKRGIFEGGRVAHGYFLVSAAAGLFVDPDFGPVLANYGLEDLRFMKPVYVGAKIKVYLTCKRKMPRDRKDDDKFLQGVVEWDVCIEDHEEEEVALYSILTMVRRKETV